MGVDPLYQKLALNDDASDPQVSEKSPTYQSPWRKHLVLILLALGTVIAALVTALFARPTKEFGPAIILSHMYQATTTRLIVCSPVRSSSGPCEISGH